METKVDFKKIKEQLPHGSQTEIAKRANVSLNTVHLALKGKCDNVDVLNAIADYLEELKGKKSAAMNRISSLID
jgi:predicted transcriptional regulator